MSLSKYLAKFHGDRIKALQSVRKALMGRGEQVGAGLAARVYDVGDQVVKVPRPDPWTGLDDIKKEFKRRGFLESILHDKGLAPKTHLIETKNSKYMVQPKADFMSEGVLSPNQEKQIADFYKTYDQRPNVPLEDKQDFVNSLTRFKTRQAGLSDNDIGRAGGNIGWFDGNPKVIDTGIEELKRAMTPSERLSALDKFISYGKRQKS